MTRRRAALVFVAVAGMFLLLRGGSAGAAPTCTISWTRVAGGDLLDSTGWRDSTGVRRLPASTDVACIGGAIMGATTVTGALTVRSFRATGPGGVTVTGTLTATDPAASSVVRNLTSPGGTIAGSSPLTLTGTGSVTAARLGSARTSIPAGSAVVLRQACSSTAPVVLATDVTVNGTLGVEAACGNASLAQVAEGHHLRIEKDGVLDLTGFSGVTHDGGANLLVNDGTIRAHNGYLQIPSRLRGRFEAAGTPGTSSTDGGALSVGPYSFEGVAFSGSVRALNTQFGGDVPQSFTGHVLLAGGSVIGSAPFSVPVGATLQVTGCDEQNPVLLDADIEVAGVLDRTVFAPCTAVVGLLGSHTLHITRTGTLQFTGTSDGRGNGMYSPGGANLIVNDGTITSIGDPGFLRVPTRLRGVVDRVALGSGLHSLEGVTFSGGARAFDATLGGSASQSFRGTLVMMSSTVGGTSPLTVPAGATLSVVTNCLGPNVFASDVVVHGTLEKTAPSCDDTWNDVWSLSGGHTLGIGRTGTLRLAHYAALGDDGGGPNRIANDGLIDAPFGAILQVPLTNDGTVRVGSARLNLRVAPTGYDAATATLRGGAYDIAAGAAVVAPGLRIARNEAAITLRGDGATILDRTGDASFAPALDALASNAGTLTLWRSISTTMAFVNEGALVLKAGTFSAPSFRQVAGTTTVGAASVLQAATIDIAGGAVDGAGKLDGDVTGNGTLAPGPGTKTIAISGDAGGPLTMAVGVTSSAHDLIRVGGTADLSAIHLVVTSTGVTPADGTRVKILAGHRTGRFATVDMTTLGDGSTWEVVYSPYAVELVFHQAV
jgi:hypothetical protein